MGSCERGNEISYFMKAGSFFISFAIINFSKKPLHHEVC